MSFSLSIQIDPHAVLGVAPGASLHEIREAYRRKAKQHHPDAGGEEWAFRILSQSYEILSTNRVVQASQAEFRARPTQDQAGPAGPASSNPGAAQKRTHAQPHEGAGFAGASSSSGAQGQSDASVRPGVRDTALDPTRVVDVEKLWVRYEVDHMWLLQDGKHDERFLSCCMNISWPDAELATQAATIPGGEEILQKLTEAFTEVHIRTTAINSRCKVQDHKFQGWLSYATTQLAWSAFNTLHAELNARGLSVKQWTRDLVIPRDWR